MDRKMLFYTFLILIFCSCGRTSKSTTPSGEGKEITLAYAQNLRMTAFEGYTRVELRDPWKPGKTLHTYYLVGHEGTQPPGDGTVVHVPLQRMVVFTTAHANLLEWLGEGQRIAGVADAKYMLIPDVQRRLRLTEAKDAIADCGEAMNPNVERIVDLQSDAVLLSPFENSGGYGVLEKTGIPIIECADYMETSALGRAEWMRFYGLLFGVVSKADSLFAEVDSCYNQLRKRASLSSSSLSIVSELKSGSAWYVPGGCSTIGRLFNDACGRYAFAEDKHSGSIPLAFETVFDKAGDADVWTIKYNRDRDMTYSDLKADYIGYTGFKAFKTRNIYGCNTAKVPFYEETPFRPDYLLSDLIQILHPEIGDLGGLRYFCKLNE